MAQPKRRWSKQRTHTRRSTWKLETPKFTTCSHCHEPKFTTCSHCHEPVMPHRVCPTCGYYNGEEVVVKEDKAANE